MPKSYVPRGVETPGQFRLPGRRRRRLGPTPAFPGGGGTTTGGGRRPPSGRPGGVLATPPVRPAPVTPLPSGPVFGAAPVDYNKLTMPSRKGSGPFGDAELRAGYRRMGEALGRADQPGVKAALEVRRRRVSGEKPPALNRGQHTALIYASGRKGSVKARREAAAAKIRLKEQGY